MWRIIFSSPFQSPTKKPEQGRLMKRTEIKEENLVGNIALATVEVWNFVLRVRHLCGSKQLL